MKGRIKRSQTYQLPVLPSATSYQSQGTYPFSSETLPRLPDALPSPPPLSPGKSSNFETMSSNGDYHDGYSVQSASAAMEIRERKTSYQPNVILSNSLFATNTNGSSAPITTFEEIVDTFSITSSGTSFSTYTQNSTIYPQASQGSAFASIPHLGLSPSPSPSFPSPAFLSPVSPLFTSGPHSMLPLGSSAVRASHPHAYSNVGSQELAPRHLSVSNTYGPSASVYSGPTHDCAGLVSNDTGMNNDMGSGDVDTSSTKDVNSPFHSSLFHSISRTLTHPGNATPLHQPTVNATATVTTTSPVPEAPSVALSAFSSPYSHLTAHTQPPSLLSGAPVHGDILQTWTRSSHSSKAAVTNPESGNMKNPGNSLNASLFLSCPPPHIPDNNTGHSLFLSLGDPHLHNTPTNNASTGNFDQMRDVGNMENSWKTVVNSPTPTESSYPFSPDLPYLSPSLSPSFSLPPSISRKPTRTSTQPGISHNYLGMSHFTNSRPYHAHMYDNSTPYNELTLSDVKKTSLPTYNEEILQTPLSFTHYDGTRYRSLPSYDLISLPDTTPSASNTAPVLATITDTTATTTAAPGALAAVPVKSASSTHAITATPANNTADTGIAHSAVSASVPTPRHTQARAGDPATMSPVPTITHEPVSLPATHTEQLFASSQARLPPRGSDASAEAVTPRGSCDEDAAAGQEPSLYGSPLTVRVGVGISGMGNFGNSEIDTMSMCSSNSTTTASYRTPSHSPTHSTLSPSPSLFGMGSSIYGTASSAFGATVSTGTGTGTGMGMGVWSSSSDPAMATLFHNSAATTTATAVTATTAATIGSSGSGFGVRGSGSGIMDKSTSISTSTGNSHGSGKGKGNGSDNCSGSGKVVGAPVRCNTFNTIVLTRAYRHNSNDGPDSGHGDPGCAQTHTSASSRTHTLDGARGGGADSDSGDVGYYEGRNALSLDVGRTKQGDAHTTDNAFSRLSSMCDPPHPPHPPHSSSTLPAPAHSANNTHMPNVGHLSDFLTINSGNNPTISHPMSGIMSRKANMTNVSQSSQNSSHMRNGNFRKSGVSVYLNNPENGKFRKSSPRLETHDAQLDSKATQNFPSYSNSQPKYNVSSGNANSQSQNKPSSPSPFSPFPPVSPSPRHATAAHAQNTTQNSTKTPSYLPMPAPQPATPLMASAEAPWSSGCGSVRGGAAGIVNVDSGNNTGAVGAATSMWGVGGACTPSVGVGMSASSGTGVSLGAHVHAKDDNMHVYSHSPPNINTDNTITANANTYNNTSTTILSSHPPHFLAFLNTTSPYMQPLHSHSPAMSVGGMSTNATTGLTNMSPSALSVSSHGTHYGYPSPSHTYQHNHNNPHTRAHTHTDSHAHAHIHAPGHAHGHPHSYTPPYAPYTHCHVYSPSYSPGHPQSRAHAHADGSAHTPTHSAGRSYGHYGTSQAHGSSHGCACSTCAGAGAGAGAQGHTPPASSTCAHAHTHARTHTHSPAHSACSQPHGTYNLNNGFGNAFGHPHARTPPTRPSVSPTARTLPSRPHGCATPQTHALTYTPASGHSHGHQFALTHTHTHGQALGQGPRHAPGLGPVSPHSAESPLAQSQPRGAVQGHARTLTNGPRAQRSPSGSGSGSGSDNGFDSGSVGGKRVAMPIACDTARTLDTSPAAAGASRGGPTATNTAATGTSASSACAMSPLVLPALAPFLITKVLTAYREEWDGFEDVFRSNSGKRNGAGTGSGRSGKDGEKDKEKDKGRSIFIAAPALPSPTQPLSPANQSSGASVSTKTLTNTDTSPLNETNASLLLASPNSATTVHPPSLEVPVAPATPSILGASVGTAGEVGSLAHDVSVAANDVQTMSRQAARLSNTTAGKTATEMRVPPAKGTARAPPIQAGVTDAGVGVDVAPNNNACANVGATTTATTNTSSPLSPSPSASPSLSPRSTVSALIHTMQQTQTQLLEIREEMNNGKLSEGEKHVLLEPDKSESESPQKQMQELISTHIHEITGIISSSGISESNVSGISENPCRSDVTPTCVAPADRRAGTAAATAAGTTAPASTTTAATMTAATMTAATTGAASAGGGVHTDVDVRVHGRVCVDADTYADDDSDTETDMDSDSDIEAEVARTGTAAATAAAANTNGVGVGVGVGAGRVTAGRMQRQYTTVLPRAHNTNTNTGTNSNIATATTTNTNTNIEGSATAVTSGHSAQCAARSSGVQPVQAGVSGGDAVTASCRDDVKDARKSCAEESYTSSPSPASTSSPSPTAPSRLPPLPPFLPPSSRLLSSFAAHINTHDTSLPPVTTPVDCALNCLHAYCSMHTGKKAVCVNMQCPAHALEHSSEQGNGCEYDYGYGNEGAGGAVLVSRSADKGNSTSKHNMATASPSLFPPSSSSPLSPCVLTVKVYVVLYKRSLHLFINPLNGPIFPTAATPTPAALTLTLTHVPAPVHGPVSLPQGACDGVGVDTPRFVPPALSATGPTRSTLLALPTASPIASLGATRACALPQAVATHAHTSASTSLAPGEVRDGDNVASLPCICYRSRCVCRPLEDVHDNNSNKTDDAGNKSADNIYKLEEVEPLQFTIPFTQNTMMKYPHTPSSPSAPSEDYYYYHFLVFASSWRMFLRQITDRSDALYYLEQRRRMEQHQASDKHTQTQQSQLSGRGEAAFQAGGREETEQQRQRRTAQGWEMRESVEGVDAEPKRHDVTLPPPSSSPPCLLSPACPSLPIPTFALTLSLGPAVTYTRASLHGGAFTSQGHVLTGACTATTANTVPSHTNTRSNDGAGGDRGKNSSGKGNPSTANISRNGTTAAHSDSPVVHPGAMPASPSGAAAAARDATSLALASKTASTAGANNNDGLGGNSEGRHPKKSGKLKIPGTPQISPVSSHSPSSASFFPPSTNVPPQGRKHAAKLTHTPPIAPNQISSSSPYFSPSSSPSAGSSPLALLEAHLQQFAKKIHTYVRSGGIDEAASVLQQALRTCGGVDVLREVPASAGRSYGSHYGSAGGSAGGNGGVSSPSPPQTHTHPRIAKNTPSAPPHEWQVLPYHCMDASASVSRLGFDVNDVDAYGRTLLMFACVKGMSDVAQLCLKYGADIYAVDKFGQTCLLYALKNKHHLLAEYLLLYPMDVSHVNLGHFCPLVLATMNTQAHIVSLIVDRNADVNTTVRGKSLLLFSVIGKHQDISALLVRNDATLNTLSVQGTTPKSILQWAVDKNMCNLVLLMLKHGARVKYYYPREVGAEEKEQMDETREGEGGAEKLDTRTARRREKERGRDKKAKDGKDGTKEGRKDTTLQSATSSSILAVSPPAIATAAASVKAPTPLTPAGAAASAATTTSTCVAAGSDGSCALAALALAQTQSTDDNDAKRSTAAGTGTGKSTNVRVCRVESNITTDDNSVGSVDAHIPHLSPSSSNTRDGARGATTTTATNSSPTASPPPVLSRDGAGVGDASEATAAAVAAAQETVEIDMVAYAIKHNNSVIVKHLCESGLVDLHWSDALRRNYIMYSALHNKADLVAYFIDKGVDMYQVSLVYDEHLADISMYLTLHNKKNTAMF